MFGSDYDAGTAWLRILLIGQSVNVSVGAAGFILIMVGRTTWDLAVYASSFVLDLAMALLLVPHLGPKGAAIAQATTLVFSNALRLYLVWRFVRIQPYDRDYARLLIPAAIGAVRHARRALDAGRPEVGAGPGGNRPGRRAGLLHRVPAVRVDASEKGAVMRLLRRSPAT